MPLLMAGLTEAYPDCGIALQFETPFQLAVATILSAQCTDKRVNLVTPALFSRYPDAPTTAVADVNDIMELVKTTGFFRNKSKFIKAFAAAIVNDYNGVVPADLDLLVQLPGIGRKTANVVLGDAFGIPGITVDTHVGRLSRRLGLSKHFDPVKVEFDLMRLVPQPEWTTFSHRVILHGRAVCAARKPACERCTLAGLCPSAGVAGAKPGATKDRTRSVRTTKTPH